MIFDKLVDLGYSAIFMFCITLQLASCFSVFCPKEYVRNGPPQGNM